MRENAGEMRTKITPNADNFYADAGLCVVKIAFNKEKDLNTATRFFYKQRFFQFSLGFALSTFYEFSFKCCLGVA